MGGGLAVLGGTTILYGLNVYPPCRGRGAATF